MPYKSEKIKIEKTDYDRRRKLSEEDKAYIRMLREQEHMSQRALAAMFGVSRRLITFILDPEKEKMNKQRLKEAKSKGRYKYTKEKWANVMKEHRRYKQKLYTDGKIKNN